MLNKAACQTNFVHKKPIFIDFFPIDKILKK